MIQQATVSGFRLLPDDNFDAVLGAGLHVGDVLLSVNGVRVLGNFSQVWKRFSLEMNVD